jgi:hypothetical protein
MKTTANDCQPQPEIEQEPPARPQRTLSRVQCLMIYLKNHCKGRRGAKARLAKYLGVQAHMVSGWLGGVHPNAEHALGIVEWLQKQAELHPRHPHAMRTGEG